MKLTNTRRLTHLFITRRGCILPVLILTALLWGCAVAPTKKVTIRDMDASFEEGIIISTKLEKPVSFEALSADLNNCRIIYVGEQHTNASHHQIQLEVIQAVFKKHSSMAVGMEMFDHTYQDVLDQWSSGQLDSDTFLRKTHWYANWRYDFSLYSDILDFIKENHIRLVALNIPFHIPRKIRVGGIENLREDERKHLPGEIDSSNEGHRAYVAEVFGHHQFKGRVNFEDFYMAQSVWEDAMAEMISRNLNDDVMVVLAGNGHIQFKYGVPDRAFRRTGAPFRTIYPVQVGEEVELDIADYIWITP